MFTTSKKKIHDTRQMSGVEWDLNPLLEPGSGEDSNNGPGVVPVRHELILLSWTTVSFVLREAWTHR